MPASPSSRILSTEQVAGPRVHTIFALRTRRPYPHLLERSNSAAGVPGQPGIHGLPGRCNTREDHEYPVNRGFLHPYAVRGRSVGGIGAGRVVEPVSQVSTAAAAARPSAMAQTIRDWPRPTSPATKTPSTEDW